MLPEQQLAPHTQSQGTCLLHPVPSQGSSTDSHACRLQCSLLPEMMNKTTEHLTAGRWWRKGAPGHQNFPASMPHRWFIYFWTIRCGHQIPPTSKTSLKHFQSFVDNLSHTGLRLVPFWKDQSKTWVGTCLKKFHLLELKGLNKSKSMYF